MEGEAPFRLRGLLGFKKSKTFMAAIEQKKAPVWVFCFLVSVSERRKFSSCSKFTSGQEIGKTCVDVNHRSRYVLLTGVQL